MVLSSLVIKNGSKEEKIIEPRGYDSILIAKPNICKQKLMLRIWSEELGELFKLTESITEDLYRA